MADKDLTRREEGGLVTVKYVDQLDGTWAQKVATAAAAGGGGPADVGASTAASETDAARQKVTSAIRLLDTTQAAASQLVAAKGDQTTGLWVNVKAGTIAALTDGTQRLESGGATGAAIPARALQMGGSDGTLLRALSVDTAGRPNVNINGSVAVTGTFWQATQPVSGTVTAAQGAAAGYAAPWPVGVSFGGAQVDPRSIRALTSADQVTVANASLAVTGTFWQATQPISGTVTANVGTTGGLALDATLTGRTAKVQITDGTRDGTVKAASTLPLATDTAVVVTLRESLSTPVTGTFWQATQPVSLAAGVDVTDRAARLVGVVYGSLGQLKQTATNLNAQVEVAVGGTLVDPRSIRALTSADVVTGAQGTAGATANGWPVKITDGTNIGAVKAASVVALATDPAVVVQLSPQNAQSAVLIVTATGAAAAAVTATLPAPAAGLFHYITRINIIKYASVATVGAAAPTVVTSTNLPGSLAWTLPTALAVGTQYETDVEPASPLKSSVAATATTIVAAALASIIYRVTVYYYTAP